ncbi:MAG: hypothetical protein CSA66_08030 [Proteobacteria bacterium]|nr:MAG: hypothetical protein CSA66_08030 [Pseudomonadota bacterium]
MRKLRLIGVFPHPDDEAYAAAGTLALAARAGAEVTVVVATRGELGRDLATGLPAGPELGAKRLAELRASCEAIGAGPPRSIELADGGVDATDADALARLSAVVDELRPHAVLTLGRDGVYGHVDHLACTALLDAACAGLPQACRPRILHAAFPRDLFAPVRRFLARLPHPPVVPDAAALLLGASRRDVDLVVDIRPARDAKIAAMAAHQSQLRGGDPRTFLSAGIFEALLDEEWWIHASGPPLPPGATSPLAGL